MTGIVRLASTSPEPSTSTALADLATLARDVNGSAVSALLILKPAAMEAPLPGQGSTRYLWELLATIGAADLTAARVVEPHLDARAILCESATRPERDEYAARGISFDAGSWGVFAAEAGGMGLEAEQKDGQWRISGRKPWCSLADQLDYAVVTARTGPDTRRAFAVDLRDPGVAAGQGPWISRGLAAVDSAPVDFSNVPGVPVGADNWYLQRSGFAWGGMGVAAVWYGGTVGVARRLLQASRERKPDQIALMLMGQVDTALFAARTALASAAGEVDAGRANGPAGAVLAARVRSVVAGAAERVLVAAAHGMGPGPLATEEEHARRAADLHVYIRQHHAERDDASLGSAVLAGGAEPW